MIVAKKGQQNERTNIRRTFRVVGVAAKVEARGNAEIVRNMLANNLNLSDIAKYTGLTVAEIEKVK